MGDKLHCVGQLCSTLGSLSLPPQQPAVTTSSSLHHHDTSNAFIPLSLLYLTQSKACLILLIHIRTHIQHNLLVYLTRSFFKVHKSIMPVALVPLPVSDPIATIKVQNFIHKHKIHLNNNENLFYVPPYQCLLTSNNYG